MNDAKYIGMDVHQATICAAVRDSSGNLVMEATLETKAETILEFVHGLRGSLHVSFVALNAQTYFWSITRLGDFDDCEISIKL